MPKYQDPNFDKKLYWERRNKGLSGTGGHVQVVQTIYDDAGNIKEIIPVSGKRPPKNLVKQRKIGRSKDRKFTKPNHGAFVRQQQASKQGTRGE